MSDRPIVASYCTTFLKPEMLHVYRQISALQRHDTFVVARTRKNSDRFPFDEVEIQPKVKSNFARRFWLKYVRKEPPIVYRGEYGTLEKILTRRRCDLLHVYFGHTGVHLLPFLQRWEKPSVVSFHGMDVQPREDQPGYLDKLRELLQTVPLVLARSDSLAERLQDLGCPESKIRLNRTGIPMDAYPLADRPFPADGRWRIVQACRLVEKKGLDISLRAFAKFAERFPEATYELAGEGPLLEETRALAGELGIGDRVHFHGFLDQTSLCELYHRSHLFLHPSRITSDQNQEGVPNSMLEAMATGLPVVATFHGGIPEAVEAGAAGLLYPENDWQGILSGLNELADHPDRWQAIGAEAARQVRDRYEHGAQIDRLETFYEEARSLA